jgi:hypothetical protein
LLKSTLAESEAAIASVIDSMSGAVDRSERVQRALRLLCNARGARIGHLFLRDSVGIELAASYGAARAPDGLRAFLERSLRLEHDPAGSEVTVAQDTDADSTVVSWWADPHGNVHHPWVLVGKIRGEVTLIGVASLVLDATLNRQPNDLQLCAALVSYLIESGDACEPSAVGG